MSRTIVFLKPCHDRRIHNKEYRVKTARVLCIVSACCLIASAAHGQSTITYTPTDSLFPNPERGFYSHREVQAEGQPLSLSDLLNIRNGKGQSLILRMYYLKKFRSSDLSAAQLNLIETDFNRLRQAGLKCVLRFAYSSFETDPDAPLSTVLRHLDQLKPMLEANRDVIAVMQAGLIGAWGEWYYSTNNLNNTADRRTVLFKILEVLPRNWMAQIRTPYYKKAIYGITEPLSPAEAYSDSFVARTGHHNDCFLASADDYGTYLDDSDRQFLALDTRFVPMGGETCNPSQYSACPNALQEMARYHWSYLNSDYHPTVISNWNFSGCLTEIKQRLGYRFELLEGTFTDSVKPGGGIALQLRLANRGWASPFNPRPVELILRNTLDGTRYGVRLAEDPRFWFGGDTVAVAALAGASPEMPEGSYELLLGLPDPSPSVRARLEYAIRLANTGVWEPATGYNRLLHTIIVDSGASGETYTGPYVFEPLDTVTTVGDGRESAPAGFELLGTYPNPFNASARVTYRLDHPGRVQLTVHTLLGQTLTTLVDEPQDAGTYTVHFEPRGYSSGVLICHLSVGGRSASQKMVLIR